MLIYVLVSHQFKHASVNVDKFSVDVDPQETVENLKIMITLKFIDLDPQHFDLYDPISKMKLNENQFIHQLPRSDNDDISVYMDQVQSTCCNLI